MFVLCVYEWLVSLKLLLSQRNPFIKSFHQGLIYQHSICFSTSSTSWKWAVDFTHTCCGPGQVLRMFTTSLRTTRLGLVSFSSSLNLGPVAFYLKTVDVLRRNTYLLLLHRLCWECWRRLRDRWCLRGFFWWGREGRPVWDSHTRRYPPQRSPPSCPGKPQLNVERGLKNKHHNDDYL